MTKITFYTQSGNYIGLESVGHSNYDDYGKDIVCSAISSITQTCALGILKVLNLKAKYVTDEEKGYLELRLPEIKDQSMIEKTQVLFETTYLALKDLSKGYPSYIKVEVKDYDVY